LPVKSPRRERAAARVVRDVREVFTGGLCMTAESFKSAAWGWWKPKDAPRAVLDGHIPLYLDKTFTDPLNVPTEHQKCLRFIEMTFKAHYAGSIAEDVIYIVFHDITPVERSGR
jgi:hypothetical protein